MTRRPFARAATLAAIAFAMGAGPPPEIVRARVPESELSRWFPPGTEVVGLPAVEFEGLVVRARAATTTGDLDAARLIRARHHARWEAGLLVGTTELTIVPPRSRAGVLALAPWSPAIGPAADFESDRVRASAEGTPALRIAPVGPSRVELRWQLRAREGTAGRSFALALPELDAGSLELDLPPALIPEGPPGLRIGPEPGVDPARRTWRFEGVGGAFNLQLLPEFDGPPTADPGGQPAPARPLVGGPTRIDLAGDLAHWRADWTVDPPPVRGLPLRIDLDEGLELVEISGPDLASQRTESTGPGSKVSVCFSDSAKGPSSLTIRALARVPAEGQWTVPSARPVDATWTGGTTTVRMDAARELVACRNRVGRRVGPRPGLGPLLAASGSPTLVFEAATPRPVADLTFRRPMADGSAEVRGLLRLGPGGSRIEAAITWTTGRGRLLDLAFDLPPGWTPEKVREAEGLASDAWQAERRADGGFRVHASPAMDREAASVVTLRLSASAANSARPDRSATLPRIRPVGVRVADERWSAEVDPGLAATLRPVSGRGLAWIEPATAALDARPVPPRPDGSPAALAWRWIAEDAEGRVVLEPTPDSTPARIGLVATIAADRLAVEGRIHVDRGPGSPRTCYLASDRPIGAPVAWTVASADRVEIPIEVRPLPEGRRESLGLPPGGDGWELILPPGRRGPLAITARWIVAWNGSGPIPLLHAPRSMPASATVVVRVGVATRSEANGEGLRAIDIAEMIPAGAISTELPGMRTGHALAYSPGSGALRVRTDPPGPGPGGSVIREARLLTVVDPIGGRREFLTLRVAGQGADPFELTLPDGATTARVLRDGQATVPRRLGRAWSIARADRPTSRAVSTIEVQYALGSGEARPVGRMAPAWPSASIPCLESTWELQLPGSWSVTDPIGGLVAVDPPVPPGWWRQLLGIDSPGRVGPGPASKRLDALRDRDRPGEVVLADWLTRLDAGPGPIVVDRDALASAGFGPKSRITPTAAPGVSGGLRGTELVAVASGSITVVTTPDEAANPPAALARRVAEAQRLGADATDRYQAVARWRQSLTPRSAGPPAGIVRPATVGRRTWRFARSGALSPGSSVRVVDNRAASPRACGVGLAVLAVGLAIRRKSFMTRALWVAGTFAAAILVAVRHPLEVRPETIGATWGLIASLACGLGVAIRSRVTVRPHVWRKPSAVATLAILAGFGIGGLRGAAADGPISTAILALFPFAGEPDPSAGPGDRLVLSRADHDRLRLSARLEPPKAAAEAWASGVVHRVSAVDGVQVEVESRWDLEVDGPGATTWTMPIGGARDLVAEIDGVPAPVRIVGGGQAAEVAVSGPGRRQLAFRRALTTDRDGPRRSIWLPINPMPSAKARVAFRPTTERIDVPTARGLVEVGDGEIDAVLGPADRLHVVWSPAGTPDPETAPSSIEATLLWDAEPAGDRLRARLACREPRGTAAVRLRVEPGLILRSAKAPGLVDARWEGTVERPEWVARFDPPLPDGAALALEWWRPWATTNREGKARRMPRVEPPEGVRFSGVAALRRPGDWSGHLVSAAATVPLPDEAFVRAWGELPPEPLTLAHATRFGRGDEVGAELSPTPARLVVRPKLQVAIRQGRADWRLDAEIEVVAGRAFEVEARVPIEVRIVRVEADGLTGWSSPTPGSILLRFDGPEAPRRTARLIGWLPTGGDPLVAGPVPRELAIDWPGWPGSEVEPGRITIAADSAFRWESGGRVEAVTLASSSPTEPPFRGTFPVNRAGEGGTIRWISAPAEAEVRVRSLVTLRPDSADWLAVVDYGVAAGGVDAFQFALPTDWAREARAVVVGTGHQLTAEVRRGGTRWMIRPDRPAWGAARVIIRGTRARPADAPLAFPEITPLGRGRVEARLAVADSSGRPGPPGLASGLVAIEPASFRGDDWPEVGPRPAAAYRVTQDAWSWSLRAGGVGGPRPTQVSSVDAEVVVAEDGSGLGVATYLIEPNPGAFFDVEAPTDAIPVAATVDDRPASLHRMDPRGWSVPLAGLQADRVTIAWRIGGVARRIGERRPIAVPAPAGPAVPLTLLVVSAEAWDVLPAAPTIRRVSKAMLDVERAGRLATRRARSLEGLNRGSVRGRETVLADLIRLEVLLRFAEREARGDADPREVARRAGEIRRMLAETFRSAGLGDLIELARSAAGPGVEGPPRSPSPSTESHPPIRPRRLGTALALIGQLQDADRPLVSGTIRPRSGVHPATTAIPSGVLLACVVGLMARAGRRAGRARLGHNAAPARSHDR